MASMFFPFRVLLCFFINKALLSFGLECPGPLQPPHGFSYARIESNFSGRSSEEYAKLRIELIFHTSILYEPFKKVVQEAADFWMNVLSVKPVNGRLFKTRDCLYQKKPISRGEPCTGPCNLETKCHDAVVPTEHLDGCKQCTPGLGCVTNTNQIGIGIENADLVFYVSASETSQCRIVGPLAYAGACELEPSLDRPVFAMINVCPRIAANYDHKTMLVTFKHEMMHALGFAVGLFTRFRDKDGTALWPRDEYGEPKQTKMKSIDDVNNEDQKVLLRLGSDWHVRGQVITRFRMFLVTPNVVREARNHFGCPDLEGAELEDQGSHITKYMHLESRVFFDDAIKGSIGTGKGSLSRIDFAVLDDSGWYQVDYSQAEEMDFGRNLGCDFCMKSCKFWMDKKKKEGKSMDPYCNTPDVDCRRGFYERGLRKYFSGCPLVKFSMYGLKTLHEENSGDNPFELPVKYQNFDNILGVRKDDVPLYGSMDLLPDLCPIRLENFDVTTWQYVAATNIDCSGQSDDDEDESNKCSHLGPSVLLVTLFTLMAIMLCRTIYKFAHE